MKTKRVTYYAQLLPGWQDSVCKPSVSPQIYDSQIAGAQWVSFEVDLPEVQTITATVKEITP